MRENLIFKIGNKTFDPNKVTNTEELPGSPNTFTLFLVNGQSVTFEGDEADLAMRLYFSSREVVEL